MMINLAMMLNPELIRDNVTQAANDVLQFEISIAEVTFLIYKIIFIYKLDILDFC